MAAPQAALEARRRKAKFGDIDEKYLKRTTDAQKKSLYLKYSRILESHKDIVDEVIKWTDIVSGGHDSQIDNKDSQGNYNVTRQSLHDSVVKKFTSVGRTRKKPKLILFGGPSGSGKGGLLKMLGDAAREFNYVNNDEVKKELPEYNGKNSMYLHEEASDVVNEILSRLEEEKANIIIDGTLKTKEKAIKLIEKYKKLGYEVELMSTNLPLEQVLQRNIKRLVGEGEEGRYVPLSLVVNTAEDANLNQFEIMDLCDKATIYDTNVEYGKPYKVIARREKNE